MEEIGNIRRNARVKSWTNYLVTLENVAEVGSLGLERRGWRGRGRGGNKEGEMEEGRNRRKAGGRKKKALLIKV